MPSGIGEATEMKRMGAIEEALQTLQQRCEGLQKIVMNLESRLAPILSTVGPQTQATEQPQRSDIPLVAVIEAAKDCLRQVSAALSSIEDRIEL